VVGWIGGNQSDFDGSRARRCRQSRFFHWWAVKTGRFYFVDVLSQSSRVRGALLDSTNLWISGTPARIEYRVSRFSRFFVEFPPDLRPRLADSSGLIWR
jgi:hypothetical protein